MKSDDAARTLQNFIPVFTGRDWGSPEKNKGAVDLAKSIQEAVNSHNEAKMKTLIAEVEHFMSPSFVLFKRVERLVERQGKRTWRVAQDNETWSGLMRRAVVVVKRKDSEELTEIASRAITFLRQRNEHVLAKGLEEAMNMCKSRK